MKEIFGKNKIFIAIVIVAFIIGGFVYLFNIDEVEARSGCCSWHGGVCTYKCPDGVNIGYYCCDGTPLSAKCAPYYPSCPAKPLPKCPSHSTYNPSSDSCECNYGYIASGGECIDTDTYCHDKYSSHSSYDTLSKSCECDYGYELINGKCVEPEPVKEQLPIEEQSTGTPVLEGLTAEKPESTSTGTTTEPPAQKEGLLAPEKFTAEIPKEGNGGSIWWWIIGIGVVGYLFYTFKKRKNRRKE